MYTWQLMASYKSSFLGKLYYYFFLNCLSSSYFAEFPDGKSKSKVLLYTYLRLLMKSRISDFQTIEMDTVILYGYKNSFRKHYKFVF